MSAPPHADRVSYREGFGADSLICTTGLHSLDKKTVHPAATPC